MDQASRAARLVDRGQFKSFRQVSKATHVARSTIQDRHAGRQPRGQEEVKHARLTRYQEEVLAKYIQNTQLQYALVNREQLRVVADMLTQFKRAQCTPRKELALPVPRSAPRFEDSS